MPRKNRLSLPATVRDRLTEALGGKKPTADRLIKLIEQRRGESAMDKEDHEHDRQPMSPEAIAGLVQERTPGLIDVGEALENAEAARRRRVALGTERVQDRIAEHRERGLDPNAPPEDPEAAKLAEEGVGNAVDPTPAAAPPAVEAPADRSAILNKAVGVFDRREREVLQRMPQIASGQSRAMSLDQAAELIIAELQPNEVDAIRQVCSEEGLDPWVVVAGALKRQAQLQELHAGEFDPEWRNKRGDTRATQREQKCEACGGVLPSEARRGQKFCCSNHGSGRFDHNDGCALSHIEMRQGRWIDLRLAAQGRA
jgi:hypothetical protein